MLFHSPARISEHRLAGMLSLPPPQLTHGQPIGSRIADRALSPITLVSVVELSNLGGHQRRIPSHCRGTVHPEVSPVQGWGRGAVREAGAVESVLFDHRLTKGLEPVACGHLWRYLRKGATRQGTKRSLKNYSDRRECHQPTRLTRIKPYCVGLLGHLFCPESLITTRLG